MSIVRRLYRELLRRLPARVGYALWRLARRLASLRRNGVEPPAIDRARLAIGMEEAELAAAADALLAEHGGEPSRLLLITDCDAVHVAAARGVRLEYVPGPEALERLDPAADRDAFLEGRIDSIRASYRIARLER